MISRLLPRFIRRMLRRGRRLRWLVLAALTAWGLHRWGRWPEVEVRPPPPASAYDRGDWNHWIDVDGDCQDTRQEVLIAESEVPVSFRRGGRCKVTKGRWRCPYTGRVFSDPRKLDVDHMVPLHEAHRSGGYAWGRERRQRYANELDDPGHLVAVERGSNRSKGDKAPDRWMPANPAYRCAYIDEWVRVKDRWSLETRPAERSFIERARQACERGDVPPLAAGP